MVYEWYHIDDLAGVSPHSLYSYLKIHGWEKVESYGDKADIFALDRAGAQVLVPASAVFSDYSLRLWQVVNTLSETEDRSAQAVLRDLSMGDYDLVRVGSVDGAASGIMTVDGGLGQIRESRNLLLAAACSAVSPRPVFRAGRNAEAVDYLRDVQLGPVGREGFQVDLLSPVPPDLRPSQFDLWGNASDQPFPRRVTTFLVSGLRAVGEALAQVNRGGDIRDFEGRVQEGVSANLCDAVGNLLNHMDSRNLDISVQWSFAHHSPEDFARVRFASSDASILEEASRVLKDRHERPDERIEGYVTAMARGESETQGRATIRAFIDGMMSAIRASFDPDDYSRIVHAHDNRRFITLEGDLRRDGQRWVLFNPRDLVVNDGDDVE